MEISKGRTFTHIQVDLTSRDSCETNFDYFTDHKSEEFVYNFY